MEGVEQRWARARAEACRFLRRYSDAATRDRRDDVLQDASLLAWQWARGARDPARIGAALRTIARRQRYRALVEARRARWLTYVEFGAGAMAEPAARAPVESCLRIGGRDVPMSWARARLSGALARLSALDRQLLLGFHEGFCCAELAHRFGRSEDCVKTRLCRARRRLRHVFEGIVRAADELDPNDRERSERR